ncbi:uncharacterized protein LOC123554321 isoform X4 [Mercenaria mercenaria]|uniref:uncharacterized protein LOC123554321 isoform X4 n=1 Tax=Mercenaria mercenaria TaxID=6596 RepID=UPI00234E641F|nr:uncharacterized protein LOC123554321 isoform X4 [Mercenaria mercenaria]
MLCMDIKLIYNKRMADVEVQKCLDWLLEQKNDLEETSFGCNRQSVNEGTAHHSQHKTKLREYIKHMDKLKIKHTLTDEELSSLYGTYQTVQTLADKKTSCFEVMNGITNLEDHIQGLSTEFDNKAVHLVNLSINNRKKAENNTLSNESMAKTTKNCVSGVRQSWRWVDEVMQCAHVHLANAGAYHEFFHDVEEVDYWMNNIMSNMHLTFSRQRLDGDSSNLSAINSEMKDTLMAYLRWQGKVDSLFARARDIVPVHKRTSIIKGSCPVLALTTYKTNEIEFQEGETLTLLNNSDKSKWQVKNSAEQVAFVPAVILLINGPTGEAIDAALRLRIQLMSLWTTSTKRLGYQMIAFMQTIFRDWTPEEIKAIQSMPKANRDELLKILKTTESTLEKNWDGYEGFEDLQERISRLRTILEEAKDENASHNGTSGEVVIQVRMLEDLLNHYQEFWTYWETYKVVVEVLMQPKYILVCDKWDELKYKSTAHFVRFWDTNLLLPKDGGKTYKAEAALTLHETPKTKLTDDMVKEVMSSTSVEKTDSTLSDALSKLNDGQGLDDRDGPSESEYKDRHLLQSAASIEADEDWSTSTDLTEIRKRQQTTTDQVTSSTEEVRHTFVIKKVTDPRTEEEISLTEAVLAGIIDQASSRYVNIVTGESVSLQEAMAMGDIVVEFKSQKKIREEKSSYGIITIKTSVETRPYTILSVIDPKTEKEISVQSAYRKGILSKINACYKTETGEEISVTDAIQSGLVKAEFHGEEQQGEEEETKTYAVNAVCDQKRKTKVPFQEAMDMGLLDAEEGVYVNNVTKERIPITDAIMSGLIKAKIVTDTSKLDIDPTNRIVVRRTSSIKEKVLKAVKVSRAFRSNIDTINGQ